MGWQRAQKGAQKTHLIAVTLSDFIGKVLWSFKSYRHPQINKTKDNYITQNVPFLFYQLMNEQSK